MKYCKNILYVFIAILLWYPGYAHSIPAFPGAEGFGANTVGGRGGTVIKVTNLNDSGAGSLREAVTASGPRIVVFTVSGIIELDTALVVSNPYITIAGQTSPGGILISNWGLRINTHEVIVQHIRFRMGQGAFALQRDGSNDIIYYDQPQYNFPPTGGTCLGAITTEALGFPCAISGGADPEAIDPLQIVGNSEPWFPNPAYNIIIDHCSVSWGVDELVEVSLGATNVTVQWSVMSEGLSKAGHQKGEHSKGFILWGRAAKTPMNVSFHHNYLAHNKDRNPMVSGSRVSPYPDVLMDTVNNIAYNFLSANITVIHSPALLNVVHNYAKIGPDTNNPPFYEIAHVEKDGYTAAPQLYVAGNIGINRTSQSDPDWSIGETWSSTLLSTDWQKASPWPAPAVTQATMSSSVADCILSAVGATAPVRDSVDARVIQDFTDGTGAIINSPPAWPTFSTPAAPTDTDNDGMADHWETSTFGNLSQTDSGDLDGDGYTNIEEYLHYLSIKSYTLDTDCMPDIDIVAPSRPQSPSAS